MKIFISTYEIKNCFQCPDSKFDNENNCRRCGQADRPVVVPGIIPQWCPLEDAPE